MKIAVLGASGMLGSMLVRHLSKSHQVIATVRDTAFIQPTPNVEFWTLDAMEVTERSMMRVVDEAQWVINAIGLIKQRMEPNDQRALTVNVRLPYLLANAAARKGSRVIQIATDCVFPGTKGQYAESSPHGVTDLYSRTKSLGELNSPNTHHLRCSIVGPARDNVSLMGWFFGQDKGAVVNGYTNHFWNGITTLHFAKICEGIIGWGVILPHLQHIVPADSVSKDELLWYFKEYCNRIDLTIIPEAAPKPVDRTLATENSFLNHSLWSFAGYPEPPTIEQMVRELAEYTAGVMVR